jgi:tetrapyrrole methylase family protein/MazG family protein
LLEAQRRYDWRASEGLQILTAAALLRAPFDPGLAVLLVPDADADDRSATHAGATANAQAPASFRAPALPGRQAHASDAAALLRALYPAAHPVLGLEGAPDTRVGDVTAAALAERAHLIPPLRDETNTASPHALPWLVARLRAPDGCPWDREQTHRSLRNFLLEESYEVYDALEAGSTPALAGELGDLLLQVILHAHYAAEEGVFDLSDVYRAAMTKIVRRHPHVFGDVDARSVEQVIRNWERIKADERAALDGNGSSRDGMPAAFRGLSRSLPALAYSQEIQERAASLGYDWPAMEPVLEKLAEELGELQRATSDEHRTEEFGDLLLVLVNIGRKMGIDTEAALRAANAKFARRFAEVERLAAAREVRLTDLSFEELDELWRAAKQQERSLLPAGEAEQQERSLPPAGEAEQINPTR